ncbi:right-handed parallel beta-helix repeat-containing protein [Streptomyces coeruleorubidus]|uniref:right-handed parallel beta-helix repeat-containing protein n=1 Tax=Streptomyces coeruleorubidus TaxID=116188 RepID=UPI0033AAFBDE
MCLSATVLGSGCVETPHYTPYATYYVSPEGDDRNDGRSPSRAWRTLSHADDRAYTPGDRLLLKGGALFKGPLELGQGEAGRADRPVVVGSYGDGRATIEAHGSLGISVHNTGGIEIRDLRIVGRGSAYASEGGIDLYSDLRDDRKLRHVVVSGVDVSGFRVGIQMGAGGRAGFRDVRITDSAVHDIKDMGLLTYGPEFGPAAPWSYSHENVLVSRVVAHHIPGDSKSHHRHTGDGIIFGSVRGGRIQHSSAHDNGWRASSKAQEGPVGIWAYDSTGVLIERNTAYRNHSGNKVDGGGFGLDSNVSDSVVQYNLAFGNDGPGFHAFTSKDNSAHDNNVFRFNVSSKNARTKHDNGELDIHGVRLRRLQAYNNTLVTTDATGPPPTTAVRLVNRHSEGIVLRNNILVTESGPVITANPGYAPDQVTLQGNNYFSTRGDWSLEWGNRTYRSLGDWRSATGQEMVNAKRVGLAEAPCFAGGELPEITRVDAARLMVPACGRVADQGLDVRSLFGVDPGSRDYFGTPLDRPLIGAIRPAPRE